MTFEQWQADAPAELRLDPLWRMKAYQLSVYVGDIAAADWRRLSACPGVQDIAMQLYRAAGSVGANIAEGYSRSSGRDRVRQFEYALGSAREALHWYRMLADVPSPRIDLAPRVAALVEIRRLLMAIIPAERARTIRKR